MTFPEHIIQKRIIAIAPFSAERLHMRIAVASEGLNVAACFGLCSNFNCFTVEEGEIIDYRNLAVGASHHSSAVDLLCDLGLDVVFVDSISKRAEDAFSACGITVLKHVSGDSKLVVEEYLLSLSSINA